MQEIINAVVIDDQLSDIYGISEALCAQGISTLPVHYKKDATTTKALCREIAKTSPRVIITDIQLEHAGDEPSRTDINLVAGIVFEITKALTGPYVLLAWTSKADHIETLAETVNKLCEARSVRKPMLIGAINKTECKLAAGDEAYSVDEIFKKFQEYLANEKQIRALMNWEKGVMNAAHRAVNSLLSVPNGSLADTLHQLGVQAVGEGNLPGHEATAINSAVSSILNDEMSQYSVDERVRKVWAEALDVEPSKANAEASHRLNTLLHFDLEPKEQIIFPGDAFVCADLKPFFQTQVDKSEIEDQLQHFVRNLVPEDRGAITKYETKVANAHAGQNKIDAEKNLNDFYLSPKQLLETNTQYALLEVSPACDFSQKKRELKTFVMGAVVPTRALLGKVYKGGSTEDVMNCRFHWGGEDSTLLVSAKYQVQLSERYVMNAVESELFRNRFRMRDSLLQSWIQSIAQYNSRIGTISF